MRCPQGNTDRLFILRTWSFQIEQVRKHRSTTHQDISVSPTNMIRKSYDYDTYKRPRSHSRHRPGSGQSDKGKDIGPPKTSPSSNSSKNPPSGGKDGSRGRDSKL
ncbi:hypothetical protein HRR83_000089 [Exophiala dermatitidis]|uniref:Uncharacterized protein n=1 Tax=Exophiala dermatitidis TaxID=5970 RepID=A0AAN6F2Q8_EXODE|nr:hypothetical protein HRR73_002623 [Exophiala dermatitidis]KAJ4527338.1 hypothetical protein HRR74_000090 [Exophiala dermatitidis]KAJ4530894.1 hypothetical protein HRR76_008585 [Exophiala dermatitidis]KAJ4558067.1 hypothetical protein HRR77_000090 [Exophiala dermatitidis]KAJ4581905.1 hypothetical protein HRR79_000909 [Exophiala dermatitidis]